VKKAARKGIVLNATDELMVPINNKLEEDDIDVSGLDAAIDALTPGGNVDHPERRQKVPDTFQKMQNISSNCFWFFYRHYIINSTRSNYRL
jgi:hypothetical protein